MELKCDRRAEVVGFASSLIKCSQLVHQIRVKSIAFDTRRLKFGSEEL